MWTTVIRRYALLSVAITFICIAIFPIVFFYGCSLLIKNVVSKKTGVKIEKFWDTLGKPYEYLIKRID